MRLDAVRDGEFDADRFVTLFTRAWLDDYLSHTPGDRDVVAIPLANGFEYLFDATVHPADDEADNRVLGGWGRSLALSAPRDRSRMAGYPSPQRDNPSAVDRGHLIAHSIGGGLDLNLIPQIAAVNRKGRWRKLEAYCAANPGTFLFVHAVYDDLSDHPAELEFGIVVGGQVRVERFANR